MWDWLNLRRRTRRRAQTTSNEDSLRDGVTVNNASDGSTLPTTTSGGPRPITQPFFVPAPISESPPKCISRLPCSQILYGERVEDFSSECWLENHLHRFGLPANAPLSISNSVSRFSPLYEDNDDSATGSSETDDSLIDYFDLEFENDFPITMSRPRLALEQLFIPLEESDADTAFDCYDLIEPPPYSEFDPPPSYEEAVQHADRRSSGTRSSSGSSLAFMW